MELGKLGIPEPIEVSHLLVLLTSLYRVCHLSSSQGCGPGLDASVSMPSRGAVVPRLGLASAARLNVLVLTSVSGFKVSVSPRSRLKRPRAHPWHFSITYQLCLNMPFRFSLSSRLPPLLFRTTSVLRMMWMWDVASVFTPQSRDRLEAQ